MIKIPPTIEEAKEAARNNPEIKSLLNKGFREADFYSYRNAKEEFLYAKIRLDSPDGNAEKIRLDPPEGSGKEKWIRPFCLKDGNWVLKEPDFDGKKPLYNLPELLKKSNETVWIVEGEKCADALTKRGIIATTSGSAASANGADWSPLAGKKSSNLA